MLAEVDLHSCNSDKLDLIRCPPGLGWMGRAYHYKTFLLLLALFCWSTPSWLKVVGGVGGGPCDYCVSPSPKIGFWELLGYSHC